MEQQQQQKPQAQPQPTPPQQQQQPVFFTLQTQQQQQPQPQPQPQPQQQVFVTIPQSQINSPAKSSSGFNETAGKITGVIQVMCGIASVVLGAFAILFGDPMAIAGYPIWSGILYFVCGILGACTKRGKTCLIVAYMVMCIISSVFASGQFIFELIASIVSREFNECYNFESEYDCDLYYGGRTRQYPSTGMHVGAAIVALAEIVAAIVGSAYCCHGVCRSNQGTPVTVHYTGVQQSVQQSGQHVSIPYPQPGVPIMMQYTQPGASAHTPLQGTNMYYPPQGMATQFPPQGVAVQYPPQGMAAQYPPQGVAEQYPTQGAPPDYDTSVPQDKADLELLK